MFAKLPSLTYLPEASRQAEDHAHPADLKQPAGSGQDTSLFVYLVAAALGVFAGWVNQIVADQLLTALCVLAFSMFMGVWKKQRPWRWLLSVWLGVPLTMAYYHFVVHRPHDRGQIYGAFLQVLAASAGANGGHFMREMIDHVFLKRDD